MKCCVSTDVGTWTNWLTFFEPDRPTEGVYTRRSSAQLSAQPVAATGCADDRLVYTLQPDAGTGLLSPISYRLRNFAALPMLPASCAATRNFTSGKSHVHWRRAARVSRSFYLTIQPIAFGVIWSLLFFVFFLFVCTVEDISTPDGAIGVKFWLRDYPRPRGPHGPIIPESG